MTKKNYLLYLSIFFFILVLLIYSINFYFLSRLSISNNSSNKLRFAGDINDSSDRDGESGGRLKSLYKEKNPKLKIEKLVSNFKPCNRTMSYAQLWNEVDKVRRSWNKLYLKLIIFNFPVVERNIKRNLSSIQSTHVPTANSYETSQPHLR